MPYPYSRSLCAIQQMKLHAGLVNDPPGQTIEGIDLSENRALADATKTRVARAGA